MPSSAQNNTEFIYMRNVACFEDPQGGIVLLRHKTEQVASISCVLLGSWHFCESQKPQTASLSKMLVLELFCWLLNNCFREALIYQTKTISCN
jgi:hypothetical protein